MGINVFSKKDNLYLFVISLCRNLLDSISLQTIFNSNSDPKSKYSTRVESNSIRYITIYGFELLYLLYILLIKSKNILIIIDKI